MYNPKYQSYKTPTRPTEFIWANNLALLLIEAVDYSADVWTQLKLTGEVKPNSYMLFIQTFRSLYLHTSEHIHANPRKAVKRANDLFENIGGKSTEREKIEESLEIFKDYNYAIHHSPALLKLIETVNIFTDDGK